MVPRVGGPGARGDDAARGLRAGQGRRRDGQPRRRCGGVSAPAARRAARAERSRRTLPVAARPGRLRPAGRRHGRRCRLRRGVRRRSGDDRRPEGRGAARAFVRAPSPVVGSAVRRRGRAGGDPLAGRGRSGKARRGRRRVGPPTGRLLAGPRTERRGRGLRPRGVRRARRRVDLVSLRASWGRRSLDAARGRRSHRAPRTHRAHASRLECDGSREAGRPQGARAGGSRPRRRRPPRARRGRAGAEHRRP